MGTRRQRTPEDDLPDVRDGLTRLERVVLFALAEAERELHGRSQPVDDPHRSLDVPTALLYGRVLEHIDVGVPEFQAVLERLIGRRGESEVRRGEAAARPRK